MTRRERFFNAVSHKPVDRAVFDLYGCPQTQIVNEVVEDMKKLLHLEGDLKNGGYIDERILELLDIDTRMTGGFPRPKSVHSRSFEGGFISEWGVEYKLIGGHSEITKNPLKDMPLEEIMRFPFPRAEDINPALYDAYRAHAKRLYEETDYVVVAQHPVYGVLELGCWMFGYDDFLYRLAGEPETVQWFFDKILDYQKKVIKPYYEALGEYIHCTTSGDDFGTQQNLFMSVSMFEETVKPYFKERIAYTKSLTPAFFQHHSCGSIFDLIPTLIDCGVDILNPIQPGAYKMEPDALKNAYGGQISFWGGVDTQHLLVEGSPEDVKQEVHKILSIFGHDGGYILSPAHCIQEDVPAANVLAIYQGAREFYQK